MAKSADAGDLKSPEVFFVWVRIPPPAPTALVRPINAPFAPGEVLCHIPGILLSVNPSERSLWARGRVLAAAFHLAAFGLVAPMLVVCEDGERHRAIESVISLCCPQGRGDSSDALPPQAPAGTAVKGCAECCTDTPLLTSIDVTATKLAGPASEADALVPPVRLARCPAPVFSGETAGLLPAPSSPHLTRSTVLRI